MIKNETFSKTSKSDTWIFQLSLIMLVLSKNITLLAISWRTVKYIHYIVKAFQVNIRQGDQSKTLSSYVEPHTNIGR